MARILAVGNATLDIINLVEQYPEEDQEVRAVAQYRVRGGNTANTLVVLSQLGHQCHWAGTLADEADAPTILDDLARYHVDTGPVRMLNRGKIPTSYVSLSQQTGTRTIVHVRDLPEYRFDDFAALELGAFDWIHFEGRNLSEVERMLSLVGEKQPYLRCSLEVEKPRPGIERLFDYPALLLFSRVYARHHGYPHARDFLSAMHSRFPNKTLICAWGDEGAWMVDSGGTFHQTPAFPPARVVDTLGAGDVFNAGIIDAMLRGDCAEGVLQRAARLAGRKCGQQGFDALS